MPIVQNVTVNVPLVITMLIVPLVLVLEILPQNVTVHLDSIKSLLYLMEMNSVPINMDLMMELVKDVPQDVLNVMNSQLVKSVKLTLID